MGCDVMVASRYSLMTQDSMNSVLSFAVHYSTVLCKFEIKKFASQWHTDAAAFD